MIARLDVETLGARFRRIDLLGLLLLVGAAAWVVLADAGRGSPAPVVTLMAACGLVLVAGRILGTARRWIGPALVVAVAGLLLLSDPRGTLSAAPLAGPFGYANAKGTFFALAAAAALTVATAPEVQRFRAPAVVATVSFAVVPLASHVAAASVLTLVLLPVALVMGRRGSGGVRILAGVGAVLTGVALAVSVVIGLGGRVTDPTHEQPPTTTVSHLLSWNRIGSWHEAMLLAAEHPIGGIGAGRYAETTPFVAQDRELRWAFNEYLQQAAEGGIPAMLLLLGLGAWCLLVLRTTPSPDVAVALAAAAVTIVGVHAAVDHILHVAAVPLALALLVGSASAGPSQIDVAGARK